MEQYFELLFTRPIDSTGINNKLEEVWKIRTTRSIDLISQQL